MPNTSESGRLLPKWVGVFFIAAAVVLIPWIIVLMTSTPHEFGLAKHWKLVWVGFDCFLVVGFAVTAYRVLVRSPRGVITATFTGTMLLVDAWFDILTSRRPTDQLMAVLMALFAEIPCALICFYVARKIVSMFEQATPHLSAAGFRIVGGRLVAPSAEAFAAAVSGVKTAAGVVADTVADAVDAVADVVAVPANGVVNGAVDGALGGAAHGSANGAVNGTVSGTASGSVLEMTVPTVRGPVSRAAVADPTGIERGEAA